MGHFETVVVLQFVVLRAACSVFCVDTGHLQFNPTQYATRNTGGLALMSSPAPLPTADKRIIVIGTTGSGKTVLAQEIAQRFAIPHIELDALYWGPDWTPYPQDDFRASVEQSTRGDNWVIDGNHSHVRDIVWPRANTLIWLDYSLPVIFWNLIKRTTRRLVFRQELWHGNRETLQNQFVWRIASRSLRRATGREDPKGEQGLSIDNEIANPEQPTAQTLNAHQRRRSIFPQLFNSPEAAHLDIIILRSPKEAALWLGSEVGSRKSEVRSR